MCQSSGRTRPEMQGHGEAVGAQHYLGPERAPSPGNTGLSSKRWADVVQMDAAERMQRQAGEGNDGMGTWGKYQGRKATAIAWKVYAGQWWPVRPSGPRRSPRALSKHPNMISWQWGNHRRREITWPDLHFRKNNMVFRMQLGKGQTGRNKTS